MPITFYNPTQAPTVQPAFHGRLESLQGKTIGLLWNNRPRGDLVLNALGTGLTARYGVSAIVSTNKLRVGVGAPQALIDDLARRTDAVIVGVGD